MYGLINQALKDMVCERPDGARLWGEICRDAGVESQDFEALEAYEDRTTEALVGATARKLGSSPEEVLYNFGFHWISYTAEHGYGEMMDMFGKDLRSCLKNLNRMHGHMGAMMPKLSPPRFIVAENSADHVTLHYFSKRAGLGSMVVGLLDGLARKYGEHISIEFIRKGVRSDHDEFEVYFHAP